MTSAGTRRVGLLCFGAAVLGFYILVAMALAAGPISAEAERRANMILMLEGHDWATAESHGRGVAIHGAAPSAAAGEAALKAVRKDWAVRRAWAEFTVDEAASTDAAGASK